MTTIQKLVAVAGAGLIGLAAAQSATAADRWPFKVVDVSSGTAKVVEYQPLKKAAKKWHICILFPHMKDSYWVGVNYGIMDQAKAMGVKATLFQAGGYTQMSKQVSQYNDCVALGVDAIIIGAISEAGLTKSMQEGKAKGIVQVGVINPIKSKIVDAKIFAQYDDAAEAGAQFLVKLAKQMGTGEINALHFPGPQGSGWAEASTEGFKRAIKGTNIKMLAAKYGDTGKSVQLKLVEDALQTYDNVKIIYGTAVTAEVAGGALRDRGMQGKVLVAAYYSNEGMIDLVKSGEVAGTVTESPVMEGRIAVDLAIRVLEKKQHPTYLRPTMVVINKDNIKGFDMLRSFAPKGWKPIYSIK